MHSTGISHLVRAARVPLLTAGVVACAHTGATPSGVPMVLGRWSPPDPQSCYVDEMQPRELPPVSTVLDSAAVANALRGHEPGGALIALAFDSLGMPERVRVIERRMSTNAAEFIRATVSKHLRRGAMPEAWGARLFVSTGASVALMLGRRELCPPVLARIEPRPLAHTPIIEREPDLSPSPDWILRGDAAPRGAGRAIVATTVARRSSDTTTAADSASKAPGALALGDEVLTLRVLIDTTGAIAHAELTRAAAARLERSRLAAELGRYRFHPALEDRVPVASWVVLKIK